MPTETRMLYWRALLNRVIRQSAWNNRKAKLGRNFTSRPPPTYTPRRSSGLEMLRSSGPPRTAPSKP